MTKEHSIELKKRLNSLPKQPGVYLFKDNSGAILYIGKAKLLRNRVRSYFHNSVPEYAKTQIMVKKIQDFEYIVTDTEKEALILEANLVKLHRPRYNINLKDDKSYPYIKITNENFPRIIPTRKKFNDGGKYFGPYTEVRPLRALLRTVGKIFQIRNCDYKLTQDTIAKHSVKLCLDYHIKRCGGPCEGLVSKEEYNQMIGEVQEFLNGHTKSLFSLLTQKMQEAAQLHRFEIAAIYRDRINEITIFQSRQKVVDVNPVDRDIIAVASDTDVACGVIFLEREGKIIARRHHMLDNNAGRMKEEIIQSFIMQIYINEEYIPAELLLSHSVVEHKALEEWLSERRGASVHLLTPQKGDKAKLVQMCQQNAELLLQELLIQKQQRKDYIVASVQALHKELHLSHPPKLIEAFDISDIQGKDAVASLVTFRNGVPFKKGYRIFKIRTKDVPDDFAMIAEAVERRYSRVLAEKEQPPDLILVDGGKGQLSAAQTVLQKLSLGSIPVIGLAKRLDEVFIPGVSEAQNIPKTSPGLHLLQRIRDEAHRFALMHHRKQRKKRTIMSELDKIPGVGEVRKRALITHFGTIAKIRTANLPSLEQVKGIPPKLAQTVYDYFHK
jgi:excinuclease ABC subunit C